MKDPETIPEGQFLFVVPNILCDQIVEEGNICLKSNAWTILVLPTAKNQAMKIWEHFEQGSATDKSVILVVSYSVSLFISFHSIVDSNSLLDFQARDHARDSVSEDAGSISDAIAASSRTKGGQA